MLTLHPQRAENCKNSHKFRKYPPPMGGDASQAVHPRESDLIRKDRLVPLSLYIPRGRRSDGKSQSTMIIIMLLIIIPQKLFEETLLKPY